MTPGGDGTILRLQHHAHRSRSLHERVTNALHVVQDHLQQTRVISQRRSQKALTEQAASKTKSDAANETTEAATQAREWQTGNKTPT